MIMTTLKNPTTSTKKLMLMTQITRRFVRLSDHLDWRLVLLLLPSLSLLLLLFSLSSTSSSSTTLNPFHYLPPLKSLIYTHHPSTSPPQEKHHQSLSHSNNNNNQTDQKPQKLDDGSRIAVCLVGGARRFELTGPSILQKILKVYPNNADLFLHSPLDSNAYKFSLLKSAPKIAVIRVFEPMKHVNETESQVRVLTAQNSPNGIQGLLQYFTLVEGCLTMIKAYQEWNNFTYDWVVRTRVDGYWSAPLGPEYFVPDQYVVPPGSSYGGLNDRFGVGDLNVSTLALSRLSLIPQLDSAGYRQLNSEGAFNAQFSTHGVPYLTKRLPFCVMSDRRYEYPPGLNGVPVAALSSLGPLSGAKCRPCTPVCNGLCVGAVMNRLDKSWGWTDWANRTLELCDASGEWEDGWEKLFDKTSGKKLAAARKRVSALNVEQCVSDFEEMQERTEVWDAPSPAEICSRSGSLRSR